MVEIESDDTVSRLMMSHVASELCRYTSNLAHANHIASKGWLPDVGEAVVAKHIETLRDHLATSGVVEDDSFLLRLGLTIPGMQRGVVPPLSALEPNRGGFPKRRQREAAGQINRIREALAIGRQFLPSLSQDTERAILELAELPQLYSVSGDGEWLDRFNELSNDEADELTARALECLKSNEKSVCEVGERTLQHLACFRQPPLAEATCLTLVEREVFFPSSMYRESGERTAEQLVNSIERADDLGSLNCRLFALAWTRSTIAEQSFSDWAKQPPKWAKALHLPPAEYLPCAGWYLDANCQSRDLVSKQCFRLCESNEGESGVVHSRTQLDDVCPSCSSGLVWLFDFSRAELAWHNFAMANAPSTVLCCLNCACYGPVFSRYSADGSAEFLSATEGAGATDFQPSSRHLIAVPCPSFACAEPFSLGDASTLGGVPMWLQDAEYPRCIDCDRYMRFLAQHDNGPLGEEGVYYAFFCEQCRTSAVTYQQT